MQLLRQRIFFFRADASSDVRLFYRLGIFEKLRGMTCVYLRLRAVWDKLARR